MTTYSVKNGSPVDKAFKVKGGHKIVPAGKDGEVTTTSPLTEEQIDAYAADAVKVVEKAGKKNEKPDGPTAVHRGAGSYSIIDGDNKELVEKLTKDEAEAFNKLDAAGRTAFIADKTKPAE